MLRGQGAYQVSPSMKLVWGISTKELELFDYYLASSSSSSSSSSAAASSSSSSSSSSSAFPSCIFGVHLFG